MSSSRGPLFRIIRDQRVTFLIVGALNTAIGVGWFVVFLWLLRGTIGYLGSLLCTHVVAMLCAFILNRKFVFRVTGHLLPDLARFELVNLSVLGLNVTVLPLLVEVFGQPVLLSQLVIVTVTVVYRWFAHRRFTFRRSPDELGLAEHQQVLGQIDGPVSIDDVQPVAGMDHESGVSA